MAKSSIKVLEPSSGRPLAADLVTDASLGELDYQYLKIADGRTDSQNPASVDADGYLWAKDLTIRDLLSALLLEVRALRVDLAGALDTDLSEVDDS